MGDPLEKSNVAASTAILAGLVLNKEIIQRLLRKDIMKESVIYQDIRDEGRQEGRQEGEANLVLRLLNRRIGGISSELSAKIPSLSLEQLENLGEALLDFQSRQDLEQWLENQAINPR
jgi:predicted transposase YdaD